MTDHPDTLAFINATIHTMNLHQPLADAVLIEKGQIKHVGTNAEVRSLAEARGIILHDLGKKTLFPGFYDCNVHMMGTGLNASGTSLKACGSVGDVLDIVSTEAARLGPGKWIFCNRVDESSLTEKRPPTIAELTAAAPDNPVFIIDRGWHYTLVNEKSFGMMDIPLDMHGVRLTESGEFSGRLHEEANGKSLQAFLSLLDRADIEKMLRDTANTAAAKGVTTLCAVEESFILTPPYLPIFTDVIQRMPVDVVLWWAVNDITLIKEAGLPRMGKDIMLDGSIGSRTAAFSEPYNDAPDKKGFLNYSDEAVEAMVEAACQENVDIAFHAIGDLAIAQALRAYEKAFIRYPGGDYRFGIDHWGFGSRQSVEKMAELGIFITTQPTFMFLRGGPDTVYRSRLGEEREKRGYPLREFLNAGIVVGGGSDSDVTPIDPLLGVHAALNQPYNESNITLDEALKLFTTNAAWTNREEKIKGTIETGKQADLVILSDDPYATPATEINKIKVLQTMRGGHFTHGA